MANIWIKAVSILAGNLNSSRSYIIRAVSSIHWYIFPLLFFQVREIVPGSPAAIHGMSARVRSLDGQTLVAWHITEINGRALNLLAKDGEAASRLQSLGRDVSVLIQPTDFAAKLKKQLKAHKNYKEYLLT